MDQILELLEEKWKIIVVCSSLAIFLLFLFSLVFYKKTDHTPVENDLFEEIQMEEIEEEVLSENLEEFVGAENKRIMVDIKGEVIHPGVYEVEEHDRVVDLIHLAGGLTENAETKPINFAQALEDQMMVYIPQVGEEFTPDSDVSLNQTENASVTKININTAELTELIQLKGVGEVRAQSIIAYREENGKFSAIDEIKQVSGIGEGIFDGIKDDIVID